MIQLPKYYYRVGTVNYIPNCGSFSRFVKASARRAYPPLQVDFKTLYSGDELGYVFNLEKFNVRDVLDLVVQYVDANGKPQEIVFQREIKVI